MLIDQDTDIDRGSGTFWTWLISSVPVALNFAFGGEFMIATLLADDKGTHTRSCVSIADMYHRGPTALSLIFT